MRVDVLPYLAGAEGGLPPGFEQGGQIGEAEVKD
jgi:hypothetical protein